MEQQLGIYGHKEKDVEIDIKINDFFAVISCAQNDPF